MRSRLHGGALTAARQAADTGNPGTDCVDAALTTQNTWAGNLGNDQNQPHLCRKPR